MTSFKFWIGKLNAITFHDKDICFSNGDRDVPYKNTQTSTYICNEIGKKHQQTMNKTLLFNNNNNRNQNYRPWKQ